MSASNCRDVDKGICTSEVSSDDAIVEIFNQSTQCNSDSESDDDETENPLCAVTTTTNESHICNFYYD